MKLEKGNEFWLIQTQSYGGILDTPILYRCVVIGGGEQYLIYRTLESSLDYRSSDVKIKRYDLERRAFPTRREVLAHGRLALMAIRIQAAKDMTTATTAITRIDEQRDKESDV